MYVCDLIYKVVLISGAAAVGKSLIDDVRKRYPSLETIKQGEQSYPFCLLFYLVLVPHPHESRVNTVRCCVNMLIRKRCKKSSNVNAGYGMTEVSTASHIADAGSLKKFGCSGKLAPGMQMKVRKNYH